MTGDASSDPGRALMLTPDEGHLDRRIVQEAGTLAAQGWTVDIYPAVDAALTYGGRMPDGVELLASAVPPRGVEAPRRVLRALRRRVAPVVPLVDRAIETVRYRRSDRAAAIAAANVEHLSRLGPYDAVFAHDVPVFPLASEIASSTGAALICDLHEIFPEQDEHFTTDTARRYWRSVERGGLEGADGVICVNAAVADYVRARYQPDVAVVTVHNSVPHVERTALAGRTIRDYYPIPADQRVMLFAGSLRPYANLETVVAGFGQATLHGWVLAILGDGPLHGVLDRIVARGELSQRVFLGRRAPESELLQVASSADIGLLPYQAVGINHTIATPNKLFEYIQARLPVATSRLPMIERIVGESGIGGYVDYGSEGSTAAGIRAFIDETLPGIDATRLDEGARRWSWEREEPAVLEVLASAMRRARR